MSLLDWLRGPDAARSHAHGDTQTVRRIVGELDKLEPDRARYLASFAYVMSRVARADLNVSQVETDKMVEILQRLGGLPEEQALLVVEIAKSQSRIFGGTEDFLVTREFRALATDAQRREALDCLFAVSAADDVITAEEEGQIWQIASELGFAHDEYIATRLKYTDKRSVMRRDPS